MSETGLTELRDLLQAVVLVAGRNGTVPENAELIASLRRQHSQAIKLASTALENIALTKLINDVGRRRRDPAPQLGQGELFGDHYPGIPLTIVVPAGCTEGARPERKLFAKSTIRQVKAWLSSDVSAAITKRERNPAVAALLEDIQPFGNLETTVEEAFSARLRESAGEIKAGNS